jgi:hypothetical protein
MFGEKTVFLRDALRDAVGVDLAIKVTVATGSSTPARGAGEPQRRPDPVPAPPDDIDLSDDGDDAEPAAPPVDPVALLQSNLGAQVIGEIDST